MIQLSRNIIVSLFSLLVISFPLNVVAVVQQGGQKERYTIRFGESFHNYQKGSYVRIEILFKNLTDNNVDVTQEIIVLNSANQKVWDTSINLQLQANQEFKVPFMAPVPDAPGSYRLTIPNKDDTQREANPAFIFNVIEPHKSQKLSLITVVTPEWEQELSAFVDQWQIKAASISYGQAFLCGKKTWQRLGNGDKEARQLIERALRRDMSVVFLDFGPVELKEDSKFRIDLPFEVKVSFQKASKPELNFIPERNINGLSYDLPLENFYSMNGLNGISVPPIEMKTDGKKAEVINWVATGKNPFRYPVLEIRPKSGKGRIILSQIITEGRLDEKLSAVKIRPELPAYDPFAVQFVLNLISASVGEEMLKQE